MSDTTTPANMLDLGALKRPLTDDEVTWRIDQVTDNGGARLLCYLTARTVMDRMDEAFGPFGWEDDYAPGPMQGSVKCMLTAYEEDDAGGRLPTTKCDVGVPSRTEGEKGAVSDALKRAFVKWSPAARALYRLPVVWVNLQDGRAPKHLDRTISHWDKAARKGSWCQAPTFAELSSDASATTAAPAPVPMSKRDKLTARIWELGNAFFDREGRPHPVLSALASTADDVEKVLAGLSDQALTDLGIQVAARMAAP